MYVLSSSEPAKPARFSSVNPMRWIVEIQEYFDYYEFSDADRLFFVRLFFEHPASEWLRGYRSSNPNSSWQEFLDAVYHNFDPIGIESAEIMTLLNKLTEAMTYLAKKEEKVEESSAQMVNEATPAVEEAPPAEPTECLAKSEADLVDENKVESQGDMKIEEKIAEKIEPKSDVAEEKSVVAEELVEGEAKSQTEAVEKTCGYDATPKDIKSEEPTKGVEKVSLCLTKASDGRAIPPRIDVTLLGILQKNGVRIFDLGPVVVSKLIRDGTLEDFNVALFIGVNNEGEDRDGTAGVAAEAKIWCHFHSSYFFFPP